MSAGRPDDGHVGDLVSAHLDHELDRETSAWVDAHLEECASCRDLAGKTEQARTWVRSLPDVDGTVVVERLLARHRSTFRAGGAFVGLAVVVLGTLALSATVLQSDVVPEIDDLVATHRASLGDENHLATVAELEGMGMDDGTQVSDAGRLYSAPAAMSRDGQRLRRRAMLDGDDLTVVVYASGDAVVSVFQQPGQLDWDGLPSGSTERVGFRTVWVPEPDPASDSGGNEAVVMVSEVGDLVVTVISEDRDAAVTVVDELPEVERDSLWDRVHDSCIRLTATFALGG